MSGTMQGMNIELMRLLSEKLNIGESKPNYSLRVMRKDKEGGFENFPFEIPNVVSISVDRRYNMAADELKVVIYDKNGTLSPDYSPNKEYKGVEGLPRSGFKDVLVPFNKVELDLGYADELRRVFTGQIADVSINEGSQTIELTCKNMFRRLQKPIDPAACVHCEDDKKAYAVFTKSCFNLLKFVLCPYVWCGHVIASCAF